LFDLGFSNADDNPYDLDEVRRGRLIVQGRNWECWRETIRERKLGNGEPLLFSTKFSEVQQRALIVGSED